MSVAEIPSGSTPGRLSVEVGVAILAKSLEMQKQSVEMLDKILDHVAATEVQPIKLTDAARVDLLA